MWLCSLKERYIQEIQIIDNSILISLIVRIICVLVNVVLMFAIGLYAFKPNGKLTQKIWTHKIATGVTIAFMLLAINIILQKF